MKRALSCLWVLLVLSIPMARGQAGSAELTGEVRDASGGLVVGAQVVLTSAETGEAFSTATSEGGIYFLGDLKPGRYAMTIEANGFKQYVRDGIVLATGQTSRLDTELTVGSATEKVTVVADVSALKTEPATLGQVIDHQAIVELPLNGRSFVTLVGLSTGVAQPPGSPLPRVNGGRPRVNEYLYDGISVLQPEPGQVAFFPIIDAIQEFNVHSNTPPAEFGYFSGGVINLTTKSGTNDFHGSAFEFFRNEVLNARNLFTPAGGRNPVFRRNQFGGILGGPIVKNKTFFFLDYQGTRQLIGKVRTSTVPTVLQRKGIFTEAVGGKAPVIYDPQTTMQLPNGTFTRQPFPNNTIPQTRIDAVPLALLNLYPMPTSPGTANNYTRIGNEPDNQDQFDVRLDHRFSAKDQFFGRYSYAKDFTSPVAPLPDGSGTLTSTNSLALGPQDTLRQAFAANYYHVFSPMIGNELRAGYTRRSVTRVALLLTSPASQALKLPGIPTNAAFNNELPTFLIGEFQQLGPPPNTDSRFITDVTEIADSATWLRGRHALKFGADWRFYRLGIVQPPSPTGSFTFSNLFTNLPGATAATTGSPIASFLLGQVQTFSIDLQQKVLRPRARVQEFFAEDDWKVTRKLTASFGVRWTLNFPSTEADNQGALFNLSTQQLQYFGQNGFPNTARTLHWKDLGPRLGLAYLLTPKTVVRAGYGLIWFDQAGITTPFTDPQFPFLQTVSQPTIDSVHPAFVLSTGPNVQPIPLTPDAGLGQGVFSADRSQTSGYQQQWNLAVQRELGKSVTLEIAYAGSKGTHIGVPDTNLNQLTAAQLAMGAALTKSVPNPFFGQIPASSSLGGKTISAGQLLKPFPRFTTVSLFRNNVGNTDYHALQAKLEKKFSHGLYVLVSYTRSKLIDDASSVFDASILTGPIANFPVADSFNRRLEQDVSNGDMPNAFAASWTYELPVGSGHRLQPKGVLGVVAGGWRIAGIVTLQSGLPLAVTQVTNFNSFAGFGTQRPTCVGAPTTPEFQTSVKQFLNPLAFKVTPQFSLGSCSRNPVRGPSFEDADLAMIKGTRLTERLNLDFRAEVFNVANTPPLGAPNTTVGSAAFGSITTAGDPRVVQLAMKLNF
jgi:carboxypeptidase family protein